MFLRLEDEGLSLRLRLEPQQMPGHPPSIVDMPPELAQDRYWERVVQLGSQMARVREILRSWRSQHGGGPAFFMAWDACKRALDGWKQLHWNLGKPNRSILIKADRQGSTLRDACLDIDYFYVRLCCLSPAAQMSKTIETSPTVDDLADQATKASTDMLDYVIQSLSQTVFFKFAPVKTWLCIVCGALYLLKVDPHLDDQR